MCRLKFTRQLFAFINILIITPSFQLLAKESSTTPAEREKFDFKSAPSTADWRAFMRHDVGKLADILPQTNWLSSQANQAPHQKISWQWRMGMVRKCQTSNTAFCRKILVSSLQDPALVVRHEAISSFARRYQQTANNEALRILENAFADPNNYRRGEPLFIQQKILFAIHEIGGLRARSLGHRLSAGHRDLRRYWARLQ